MLRYVTMNDTGRNSAASDEIWLSLKFYGTNETQIHNRFYNQFNNSTQWKKNLKFSK